MKKKIFLLVIILIGFISTIFPQQTFRSGVFLHHSTGNRVWDYSIYDENYLGATIPNEIVAYNTANYLTGSDTVSMSEAWFPSSESGLGNDWFNWHWIFDNQEPNANIYPYFDNNKIIVIKSCGPSSVMDTTAGGPADTTGAGVTKKTIYNGKWHLRSIVRVMEAYPDNFFVIWTGTPLRVVDINATQALHSHLLNAWLKDTLATGLDATYGAFPPNVYIWNWFHRIVDEDYYLSATYTASNPEDAHPNAAASDLMAPLFVEEIFDAAIAYESTIPVELLSFSASIVSAGVELNWSTATELNNVGFEIQKKTDEGEFIPIGFVKGQGTSTQKKDYNFVDKNTNSGKYLYRLKQIDFNGNYEYSNALEVNFSTITIYSLEQNYPNPFNPSTEISFTLANSGNITLKVYDSLGMEITTLLDGFMKSGKHSVKFNSRNFTSGVYFYRLKADNFSSTRKMLLIK